MPTFQRHERIKSVILEFQGRSTFNEMSGRIVEVEKKNGGTR